MKKYKITKNKLKKVDITIFHNQMLKGKWYISIVNEKSNNICNCCNNISKSNSDFSFSITFRNSNNKFREICFECLKIINEYLFFSIIDYINYVTDIIDKRNLFETPSRRIQSLITTQIMNRLGEFDDEIIKEVFIASDEYQILKHPRPDILFEDLANININLLNFSSKGQLILSENDIWDYKDCLCGRYYHPTFETRKQCLECYSNYDLNNDLYYCEFRKKNQSISMINYSIEKIEELSNLIPNYENYECYICNNDDVKYTFKFDCGHSICHFCQFHMKLSDGVDCVSINCPFCRHKQKLVKDNMISWSKNYISIKHELDKSIANRKYLSLTMPEQCKYRSDQIIQEMMKKRNLNVYKYLEKLETMKLLGWCDYFPDGLLINQRV